MCVLVVNLVFRISLSPDGIGVGMCFLRYMRSDSQGACTARIVSLLFVSSTTANFSLGEDNCDGSIHPRGQQLVLKKVIVL
jgi:hypothetical protein